MIRQVHLEDIASLTVGHVGSMVNEYVEDGIPFLRSLNIFPYRIDLQEIKYIDRAFHEQLKKSALQPDDVVIVRTGKPGTCAVVPADLKEANCSDLVIVRCGPKIRPRFLSYWVNAVAGDHVSSHTVGAVQQHFNVGAAKRMPIRLPSLTEQDNVLSILGALDNKIELNRKTAATLEEMARALYRSWFVDFDPVRSRAEGRAPAHMDSATAALFPESFSEDGVPVGWELGTLGRISRNPRSTVDPSAISSETPYIGLEHIPRRSISITDWGAADDVGSAKSTMKRGQFLFGKLRPYFHKVGLVPVDGICSTDILVVEAKSPVWSEFVLSVISSIELVDHVNAASTGTRMPRAKWQDLAAYEITISSEAVMEKFSETVRPMHERILLLVQENRTLAKLRDTLLPRLMSGELYVGTAREMVEELA